MLQEADNSLTNMAMAAASGQAVGDDSLLVKFYVAPLENPMRSKEEGRPIFEDVEWISIRKPGSKDFVERPVRSGDAERFPRHYQAFKSRDEVEVVDGTPLKEWPLVTRGQVEELKFFNVVTVEQLAGMPDTATQNFRGALTLKHKAKEWLEQAKDGKAAVELEKAQEQIAALMARIEALESKPKRGRPRKKEVTDAETGDSE